ncbi:flavodoxin family protein [Phocaeicola sp.]
MNKKVLILSSSPRRGGNSDTLCNEFMRGAEESGNEVEKVFLRDKTIHYCTGCSTCSLHNKPCLQKDDAAEVIEKMLVADVIVLGTPVYFYAMSAQLKTLIDRCCGLYTEMKDKEFYFIATAAEGEEGYDRLSHVFDNLMGFLDCLENPVVKGKVLGMNAWHVGEIKGNPAVQEAYEMGKQV